jgi:hypothetical protein
MQTSHEKNLLELAGVFSALILLGIVALWGGKVFYPFWLICATIHLYQVVKNYNRIDREPPIFLIVLQILFYTVMAPFYLLMSFFHLIITIIDAYLEKPEDEEGE